MTPERATHERPLSPIDAAWWRLDEPGNVADIGVLFLLDRPLDDDAARALVEEGLGQHPRFRRRVIGGRVTWPRWREDPRFAAHRHLERHRVGAADGGDDDDAALEALVGRLMSAPLPDDRPPWRLHLIERSGGRGALFARLHHCIGDGFTLARLLLDLTERDGAPRDRSRRRRRGGSPLLAPLVVPAALQSLVHLVTLPHDRETSLVRPPSGVRRAAWSRAIPLPRLRDIARGFDGTVNDVVVAGVTGSLREHLRRTGELDGGVQVRALAPVNLRRARSIDEVDPRSLGNRFGLVFVDLPVDAADPRARVARLQDTLAQLKRSPEAAVAFGLLNVLGTLPPATAHEIEHFFARKASVVVTNVPGPEAPLVLEGARIEGLVFWVPHPARLAVGMSAISYAGELRVGVRADAAAVADPRALANGFERAVDELAAAFGVR